MKIGLFSFAFPYPKGGYHPGIENVTYNLAKALAKTEDVTVYTSFINGGPKEETWMGFRIRRAGFLNFPLFSLNHITHSFNTIRSYRKEISSEDVLHDIGSHIPLFLGHLNSRALTTFHHYEEIPGFFRYLHQFPIPIVSKKEKKVKIITAVSEAAKEDLIRFYRIPEEKVKVIPNGVDLELYNPDVVPAFNAENTILFVGPLVERKGLIYLIKALPKVIDYVPDASLMLAGRGPLRTTLEYEARKAGVGNKVEFLGFVPPEELPEYYRAAAAFVFPTLKEGFGLVALESMACGTPVVASGIEPLKSIIGDAGLFFKPGASDSIADRLIEFLTDRELRLRLGRASTERAKRYSWDSVAKKYIELYKIVGDLK